MTPEALIVRQEKVQNLGAFCRALREALSRLGLAPTQQLEVWRAAVTAECVACQLEVSGRELFRLAQPPSPEFSSRTLARLRLGTCGREGCGAYHYRLTFRPHPPLNWPGLLQQAERSLTEPTDPGTGDATPAVAGGFQRYRAMAWRLLLASVVVTLFLLLRQWHLGGRIPLLREPERFRVDVVEEPAQHPPP